MTAFMLFCTLNGFVDEGAIYFKNVNEQVYDCICKVIPSVDSNKVKVY